MPLTALDHAPLLSPCSAVSKVVGAKSAPAVVTLSFIAFWYALNIAFNLQVGAGTKGASLRCALPAFWRGCCCRRCLVLLDATVCAQLLLLQ